LNADDFARESEAFQDLIKKETSVLVIRPHSKLNQWLTYLVNVVVDCPRVKGTVVKHSPTPRFLFHKKYNLTLEMKVYLLKF
jgi:hypothetical protein